MTIPWLTPALQALATWLDRQPLWRAVAIGAGLALALGLPALLSGPAPLWLLAWGALFVALGRLGYQAEPVGRAAPCPPRRPVQVRDGLLVMVDLPGGSFWMGSPPGDDMAQDHERPQHRVTVSALRMAVTPVTAGVYAEVMQSQPPTVDKARLPVVRITWEDAVTFCNRLSERAGYRPCYRRKNDTWLCDWRADGYRLPTEAEWEYACRAGTTTRYAHGDDPAHLERYAWYGRREGPYDVASKAPNPWGLYDMHGNVWEWCWDWYGPYTARLHHNPHGSKSSFRGAWRRVFRGGSAWDPPVILRSAVRACDQPVFLFDRLGFRCVRVPPQP